VNATKWRRTPSSPSIAEQIDTRIERSPLLLLDQVGAQLTELVVTGSATGCRRRRWSNAAHQGRRDRSATTRAAVDRPEVDLLFTSPRRDRCRRVPS
jgi:hypothetical protein